MNSETKINKIGIIGKGMMGSDIFNATLFHDYQIVWICRSEKDREELTLEYTKKIGKMLKRTLISHDEFEYASKNVLIHTDYRELADCDLIIESITEDLTAKQALFRDLQKVVSSRCVLASNTSSIPLRNIFRDIVNKSRCLGLHFFYPTQLINIVEIVKLHETEENLCNMVVQFAQTLGKRCLELPEEEQSILNKIYAVISAQAMMYYMEGHMSAKNIDSLIKERLFHLAIFKSMDLAGFNVVIELARNAMTKRNEALLAPTIEKLSSLMNAGYHGSKYDKGFYDLDSITPFIDPDNIECYKEAITVKMKCLYINEILYVMSRSFCDPDDLGFCLGALLGINPFSLIEEIGESKFMSMISSLYEQTNLEVFRPVILSKRAFFIENTSKVLSPDSF